MSAGAGEPDAATPDWLEAAVAGEHRDPAKRARDQYRHPREVLAFFGLEPDSSVAEIWPSDGWWTEILAPALRDEGVYYAAGFAMTADRTPEWRKRVQKRFAEKLEAQPELYDAVVTTELSVPERTTIAPPGSLDFVLTFRNVHNWIRGDYAPEMFRVMARALRPGGVVGLVTHRAPPGWTAEDAGRTGYVAEALVIEMAEAAGLTSKNHRRSTRIRATHMITRAASGRCRLRSPCAARWRTRRSERPARPATAPSANPTA